MKDFRQAIETSSGNNVASFRCSNEMYQEIDKRAEMEGKNRSEYLRAAVLFYRRFSPPGNIYHAPRDVRPAMYADAYTIQDLYE